MKLPHGGNLDLTAVSSTLPARPTTRNKAPTKKSTTSGLGIVSSTFNRDFDSPLVTTISLHEKSLPKKLMGNRDSLPMLRMAGGRPLRQELMQRPLLDPAAVDEMDAAIRAGRRPPIERGAFIEGIGEGILRLIRRDYGLPQDPLTVVRGGTQGPVPCGRRTIQSSPMPCWN